MKEAPAKFRNKCEGKRSDNCNRVLVTEKCTIITDTCNTETRRKEKAFLYREMQTNAEGATDLENHHLGPPEQPRTQADLPWC